MEQLGTFKTSVGEVLDLSVLTDDQRDYLERCLHAYRRGIGYWEFVPLVTGPGNPLLAPTRGVVTRGVSEHPLFRALQDLENRLGVRQGQLLAEGGDYDSDPLADEWIAPPEAARRKGVALQSVHAAIARGEILSRPRVEGGKHRLVSANSLSRWAPDRKRQAAGRLGRAKQAVR